RARTRLSDGVQQRTRRPERLSDRGADRWHALSLADAPDPVGHLPRASQLQATIWLAVSTGADRGVAMDRVCQRRRHGGRACLRVLARLRHRELAGLLPLDPDVLASLPQ